MERLHNRDIKIHKCEMTPEKYLHERMLYAWLAFCKNVKKKKINK